MSDFLSFEMVFFDASRVFQGYILGYVSPGGLITAQFGMHSQCDSGFDLANDRSRRLGAITAYSHG